MATVATIAVKLEAQTAQLRREFAQVRQQVSGIGSQIRQGIGSGIVRFQAWMSVIGQTRNALGGLFSTFRAQVDRMASLGDMADRINVDIEQFQRLQATVEQFGGNADQLGISLQRMSRRIADAANKGGPLADRLRTLNLNVEEMSRLDPVEQFLMLSRAIREADLSGEQLATTFSLLDMEGGQFVSALRLGEQALRDYMATVDDSMLQTEQQIRRAQALSGEMKEFDRSMDVLKGNLALIAGGPFRAFTRGLDRVVRAFQQLIYYGRQAFHVMAALARFPAAGFFEPWWRGRAASPPGAITSDDGTGGSDIAAGGASIPTLAASRSTTVQGFSDFQQLRRINDRERWEAAVLVALDRLIEVTGAGPSFTEVTL